MDTWRAGKAAGRVEVDPQQARLVLGDKRVESWQAARNCWYQRLATSHVEQVGLKRTVPVGCSNAGYDDHCM